MSAAAQKTSAAEATHESDDLAGELDRLINDGTEQTQQNVEDFNKAKESKSEAEAPAEETSAEVQQIAVTDDQIGILASIVELSDDAVNTPVEQWSAESLVNLLTYAVNEAGFKIEGEIDTTTVEQYRDACRQAQARVRAKREQTAPSAGGKKGKSKKGKAKASGGSNSGSKASKQPKQPPEPVKVETFDRKPAQLTLKEERTQKVPLPETFHLEADPDKAEKHRGHQVDPSRTESCAPVMPNSDLFAKTGNPYPQKMDDTVVTSPKYEGFCKISHLTYEHLKTNGAMYGREKEVVEQIVKDSGVKADTDARTCVQDTLRDLALYGYCTQYLVNKRTRLFKIEG